MRGVIQIESYSQRERVSEIIKLNREHYFDLAFFIVTRGVDLYLQMLLVDNLMHADYFDSNKLIDFEERFVLSFFLYLFCLGFEANVLKNFRF